MSTTAPSPQKMFYISIVWTGRNLLSFGFRKILPILFFFFNNHIWTLLLCKVGQHTFFGQMKKLPPYTAFFYWCIICIQLSNYCGLYLMKIYQESLLLLGFLFFFSTNYRNVLGRLGCTMKYGSLFDCVELGWNFLGPPCKMLGLLEIIYIETSVAKWNNDLEAKCPHAKSEKSLRF